MSTTQPAGSGVRAITISRQYGSGGGEIAARLAQRLNWQLVDHEIVAAVARRLGITPQEAGARDEQVTGFGQRLIGMLEILSPAWPGTYTASIPGVVPEVATEAPTDTAYRDALRQVVEAVTAEGQVVIVGRAAQVLLAARPDVLHARIIAPLPARVAYVARREGLDAAGAQSRILLKDRDRTLYLQRQYHRDVNDPLLYDLMINTGILSLDGAVDLIARALDDKTQGLAVPVEERGPGRGMAPYAGPPGDVRPPPTLIQSSPSGSEQGV